jgi:hypothetical protein
MFSQINESGGGFEQGGGAAGSPGTGMFREAHRRNKKDAVVVVYLL